MPDSGAGPGPRSRAADPAPAPFAPEFRALTTALLALITIVAFQEMAISTVMPTIAADLQAAGGYALAFSVMFTAQLLAIVLARAWIETRGPLSAMRLGQVFVVLGGLLAGLAPNLPVFLAGRVCTGLGGGFVIVAIYVTVGAVYPVRLRPKIFAWISAAWVLPSILGPLVAAGLAALWSWRLVFLLVVPAVGWILIALSRVGHLTTAAENPVAPDQGTLSERADPTAQASQASDAAAGAASTSPPAGRRAGSAGSAGSARSAARRAVVIAVLVAAGAGLFQWAGTRLVPPQPLPVAGLLIGLALLGATLPRLLPPGALALRRGLPSVIVARGLFTGAFNGSVAFVPLYLVSQRDLSQASAGLILALASIGWSLGAYLQGRERLADSGPALVVVGALCVTGGVGSFALLALTGAPTLLAVPAGALLGIGMGLGTTAQSVLMLALAPRAQHPAASSALMLSDTLGAALGISVTGTVYASLASSPGDVLFPAVWATSVAIGIVALLAARRVIAR
ncbi:putative drug resistance protein [Kineosphaera limosa NBRC 100340]|uniref:Putative drug resistance protein n=1 Tax=Kineosphaera limosa NBRC 100340 TaxID=1184609 RepID=K6WC57_9MICO|nr:MFS transporter [Kineosphaera limosa]GAB96820.1 putative drug resistance protein [Kineosphaera limosa NBRC 100340]